MTSVIQSLEDFEQLLIIAKRHGVSEFKLGEIAVVMPPPAPELEKPVFVKETVRNQDEIDAEIYRTTLQI